MNKRKKILSMLFGLILLTQIFLSSLVVNANNILDIKFEPPEKEIIQLLINNGYEANQSIAIASLIHALSNTDPTYTKLRFPVSLYDPSINDSKNYFEGYLCYTGTELEYLKNKYSENWNTDEIQREVLLHKLDQEFEELDKAGFFLRYKDNRASSIKNVLSLAFVEDEVINEIERDFQEKYSEILYPYTFEGKISRLARYAGTDYKISTPGSTGASLASSELKQIKNLAIRHYRDPFPGLYSSCDRGVATIYNALLPKVRLVWGGVGNQSRFLSNNKNFVKVNEPKAGDILIEKTKHIKLMINNGEQFSASYYDYLPFYNKAWLKPVTKIMRYVGPIYPTLEIEQILDEPLKLVEDISEDLLIENIEENLIKTR